MRALTFALAFGLVSARAFGAGPAPAASNQQPAAPVKPVAPPEPAKKVDPKTFDEALQDYFSKRPYQAASKLYAFLESTQTTDENYAWAEYFLGKSLVEVGLRHAGGYYFSKIAHERSNPNVIPKALEGLKTLTEIPHDETMVDEQVFGSLDLGFLPDEVSDYTNYEQGMVDLRVSNERWANTHFNKLNETSAEASKAKFALLVTRLKNLKAEPTDDVIEQFLALSKDEKLSLETRNDARLAVARLRYEKKDFQGALTAYEMVQLPKLDPGRATLYLEEAWTRYQLGQVHAAMGLLTTLDAPTFRDEFLPDKYLLRAMVFRDLCHYLPAKRAAKELTRKFAESLEAIHEREDLTKDNRLRRAAESHGATQRAHKFLDELNLEAERIGRYSGYFGDRLTAHLTKVYDLEHAEAERIYRQRVDDAVRAEADKLLRAAEQERLMEYEVGLKLYERIKRGQKTPIPIEEDNLSPEQVAYKFDGEYWNDELRNFRVSLKSRCLEETTR